VNDQSLRAELARFACSRITPAAPTRKGAARSSYTAGVSKRIYEAVLATLGAAVLLAACGSSGPTQAEYDRKANPICTLYNVRVNAVSTAISKTKDRSTIEADLAKEISLLSQEDQKLVALARPTSEKSAFARLYAQQQGETNDLRTLLLAVEQRDVGKIDSSLSAADGSLITLDDEFKAAGLGACIQASGTTGSSTSTGGSS